jgi:hypothetical protein
MIDRTREDIIQDGRIAALEKKIEQLESARNVYAKDLAELHPLRSLLPLIRDVVSLIDTLRNHAHRIGL